MKRLLPPVVRTPLGRALVYARRLRTWAEVARLIRGRSAADRAVLRRALIAAPADSLRGLGVWRDPVVDADCRVEIRGFGAFSVRAGSDDLYHLLPTREPEIVAVMRDLLGEGDLFVDAGANIGVYAVLGARLVGPAGRVIAVEMMPDTAAILRRHLAENGCANAAVIEAALSDRAGETVEAIVTPGKFGQASIARDQPGRRVSVETAMLSAILANEGEVRLMKMDLEGAELAALRGLGDALGRVGALIFEDLGGDRVDEWLRERGFRVKRLGGANWLAVRPTPSA